MTLFKNPQFIIGAKSQGDFPEDTNCTEIAFIGRSNAGKSTLVNRITSSNKLARVSSQPGKTREINFYSCELEVDSETVNQLVIADLPGFGYAKFSKAEREALSALTVSYLDTREPLKVVFLIHDSKRLKINSEEMALHKLIADAGRHLVIIVSKCDRLNQRELHANCKAIAKAYNLEIEDLILAGNSSSLNPIVERAQVLCF